MHPENKHLATAMLLSLVDTITKDTKLMDKLLHKTHPRSHLPSPLDLHIQQVIDELDPGTTTDNEQLLESTLMISALGLIYAAEAILPALDPTRVNELSLELTTQTKNS